MWYAIWGTDVTDSLEKRRGARAAHIQRLEVMREEGRLLVAGPFPAIDCEDPGAAGFTGSLIVAEFDSEQDATDWAAKDPYVVAGVYDSVIIRPFRPVLP